jgi:hypothetical protein
MHSDMIETQGKPAEARHSTGTARHREHTDRNANQTYSDPIEREQLDEWRGYFDIQVCQPLRHLCIAFAHRISRLVSLSGTLTCLVLGFGFGAQA